MTARLEWAVALIRKGRELGEVAPYGSPGWEAYGANDARKVASCVIAAECWADEIDPVKMAQRLEDEITVRRQLAAKEEQAQDAAEDAEWRREARKVVNIGTARRRPPWEQSSRQGAS